MQFAWEATLEATHESQKKSDKYYVISNSKNVNFKNYDFIDCKHVELVNFNLTTSKFKRVFVKGNLEVTLKVKQKVMLSVEVT